MKNINDLNYDQDNLGGLTLEQIESMSNFEIKQFQRSQSEMEVKTLKTKLKSSIVSFVFFAFLAVFLYFNPMLFNLSFIIPLSISALFILKIYINNSRVTVAKRGRAMLEMLFKDID